MSVREIGNQPIDASEQLEYPQAYMTQPTLFASLRWTVGELTRYLRQLLESDPMLQDVWVQGEISNLSRPSSGHIYFTLKDSSAALRCVMWRTDAQRLRMSLQDGLAVEVHGKIGLYEIGGQYQLYADQIRPVGEGALFQEFLRLKALLEAEGLFDPVRKRPIPPLPRRIGIVTSPTGAALRDMLQTLRRRLPLAEVIFAPAAVQGAEAPPALAAALSELNRLAQPDVILLARGGGSMEDLWAFNDENVVRAVAASKAPVITGVGHETDFTLADFAADLRAPTPTAAAELATPVSRADLQAGLAGLKVRLGTALTARVAACQREVETLAARLRFVSPERRILSDRQQLDEITRHALSATTHRLRLEQERLSGLNQRLCALNPLAVLARGFAVVSHTDGSLVRQIAQVKTGETLRVRVSDGEFGVEVKPSVKEQQ
ncbi:MAG: exodeoxyribonuclease VII large subunit [Candidatus Villigracilaceae bacterium]